MIYSCEKLMTNHRLSDLINYLSELLRVIAKAQEKDDVASWNILVCNLFTVITALSHVGIIVDVVDLTVYPIMFTIVEIEKQ